MRSDLPKEGAVPAPSTPSPKTPQQARDYSVYSLRGLALILMVAGHVIGWDSTTGMRVSDDSGWRLAYVLLEDVRMPLFTVLSGYVYAMRPLRDPAAVPRFVRGKARRLLLPLLTVGTAFHLVQALTPGTNAEVAVTDVWHIWLMGSAHFWFAGAIFLVFLLVVVLERAAVLDTVPHWASATGLALLGNVFIQPLVSGPNAPAWLSGFVMLFPFFLLGLGLRRFPTLATNTAALVVGTAGGGGLLVFKALTAGGWPPFIGPAVGACGAVLVLTAVVRAKDALNWRPLAWVGQFSYGVYLLHVFGAAGSRIILGRLGFENEPLSFLASLALGIAFPALLEVLFGPYRIPMLLTFGQRPVPRSSYFQVWRKGR